VAIEEWERLEFGRLKVRVPVPDKAEVSKSIKINDKFYWITLRKKWLKLYNHIVEGGFTVIFPPI